MLREFPLADVLTLGNAASGVAAILCSLLYMESRSPAHFFAAWVFTPAALIFDWFDGRVARWRRHHSALGRELDWLADIISFGVAPAVLGFATGLRGPRLLRSEPAGSVQRYDRDAVVWRGQGCLFRGHADSHDVSFDGTLTMAAWQGRLGKDLWWGAWGDRIRDPASAVAAIRPLG
jgi:CDP-diacylglycerol--serine O-phosphatidyltransferase